MNTPKTDAIFSGLLQLPDISISAAEEFVIKIRKAEQAIAEAQEKLTQELRNLAEQVTDNSDGWNYEEIFCTDLRKEPEFITHVITASSSVK